MSKRNNYYLKTFVNVLTGFVVAGAIVVMMQYYHLDSSFELLAEFIKNRSDLVFLQTLIVLVIYLWLYFISDSGIVTTLILLLFSYVISESSIQKIKLRGEPIYPSDIYFLKDINFLADMVDIQTTFSFTVAIILVVGVSFMVYKCGKRVRKNNIQKYLRIFGVIVTSFFIFEIYNFNIRETSLKAAFSEHASWVAYSQTLNYRKNGVISGILYNLKSPAMEKPDNYSKEEINKIYNKYTNQVNNYVSTKANILEETNIVFIMNESFSDAHRLNGVDIRGGDSLEKYRQIEGHHGMILSSAFGGGTANVEFEALTGISIEPLTSTITLPYIQLSQQMNHFPTITDIMKESGHYLTAIHPYSTRMYKRVDNYNSLKFDQLIFEENMTVKDKIDKNPYVSDESAYTELKKVMSITSEKDFIHLVTMQNHMDYGGNYNELLFSSSGAEESDELDYYLTGLKYSDDAISNLISYFDSYNEKVILIFWGDHLPSVYGEKIYDRNDKTTIFETPLLIYDNFSSDTDNIGIISPIYFINHILSKTNASITPYVALLNTLEDALPAFTKRFYIERETSTKENRDDLKPLTQLILEEYEMILYDITTGKNYSKEMGFY